MENTMSLDCWSRYKLALETVRVMMVTGPPGVGKTHLSYHHDIDNRELFAMTLGEEASSVELRGHYISKGAETGTVWHDGPLAKAIRKNRARFVINEISNASPDILGMLYAVLEDPATAKLTLPTGETLNVPEGFQCIFTDNNPPERSLPQALRDRVEAFIHCPSPHPGALEQIAEPLRTYAENAVASGVSGLRAWMHLSRFLERGVEVEDATEMSFGNVNETLRCIVADAMQAWNANPMVKSEESVVDKAMVEPTPEPAASNTPTIVRGADGILRVRRPEGAPQGAVSR